MDLVKVGGDTEAWCTTCKQMKDHVVVAMVGSRPAKVECAGCHKQHVYRAGPPGSAKSAPARATGASATRVRRAVHDAPRAVELDLSARLAGREVRSYSTAVRFAIEDAVRHPTFGVGLVVALPGTQKVEIAFPSGRKLLLHDKEGAAASSLQRPPRREEDERTPITDAPPLK